MLIESASTKPPRGQPAGARCCCPAVILPVLVAAFWPVWRWYLARITDGSDEPWGLLALATACVFLPRRGWLSGLPSSRLHAVGGLLAVYAVAWPHLPALVRAGLAMATLACGLPPERDRPAMPRVVLLLISLPVIASLQFYLGFPLRALTAWAAAHVLTATGFAVEAHGTVLTWAGEEILVDTPCSGIRMLWTAVYLATTLAAVHGLPARRFVRLLQATGAAVFVGNLLRTVLLFFPEARVWPNPAGLHEGIGIACFLAVAMALVAFARRLRGGARATVPADASPGSIAPEEPGSQSAGGLMPVLVLCIVALAAGIRPLHPQAAPQRDPEAASIVWPEAFEGAILIPAPLHPTEVRLAHDFPGRIAAFQDGPRHHPAFRHAGHPKGARDRDVPSCWRVRRATGARDAASPQRAVGSRARAKRRRHLSGARAHRVR